MSLPPETRIVRTPDLVAAPMGGEVVMFSAELGRYFALNESAAAVWQGIEHPVTVEHLCAALQGRFDVSSEECRQDVSRYLQELDAKGLIRIVPLGPMSEKESVS